jgi:putative transcriptional regulator
MSRKEHLWLENRIKNLREQFGFTQQYLAEKVNVSRQTIISLENGKYNPSIFLAYKIAKVFKMTIEDIFVFEEELL